MVFEKRRVADRVFLTRSFDTSAVEGIALILCQWTVCRERALDNWEIRWVVFVLLLARKHAAILDAGSLLELLD